MLTEKETQTALNQAVDYCIENDILKEFLLKNRAEVLGMLLEEFDEKKYERTLKEEGRAEGYRVGHIEGDTQRMLQSVEAVCRNLQVTPQEACEILCVTPEEYEVAKKGAKE